MKVRVRLQTDENHTDMTLELDVQNELDALAIVANHLAGRYSLKAGHHYDKGG